MPICINCEEECGCTENDFGYGEKYEQQIRDELWFWIQPLVGHLRPHNRRIESLDDFMQVVRDGSLRILVHKHARKHRYESISKNVGG